MFPIVTNDVFMLRRCGMRYSSIDTIAKDGGYRYIAAGGSRTAPTRNGPNHGGGGDADAEPSRRRFTLRRPADPRVRVSPLLRRGGSRTARNDLPDARHFPPAQ